jgi:hypothetical protein
MRRGVEGISNDGSINVAKIKMTDGSGSWFESDSAILFKENTRWDGRNHISVPTGSQWEHEWLYFTKSGRWVLRRYSQWQGSSESYEFISQDNAAKWLLENDCENELHNLPEQVRLSVQEYISRIEI